MKSGISRYTLGGFNQSALDDVYNKAKEIYVDAVEPPSSGVIENTMDEIIADMGLNEPGIYTSITGGMTQAYGGDASINTFTTEIEGFNTWNEIECQGDPSEPTQAGSTCLKGMTKPDAYTGTSNTVVEFGTYRGWWMDINFEWHQMSNRKPHEAGTRNPRNSSLMDSYRTCVDPYFKDILDSNEDRIKLDMVEPLPTPQAGSASVRPDSYFRWHGYGSTISNLTPTVGKVRCIFVQQYARLILKDPNGVDDRHLSNVVMHVASDFKQNDGVTYPKGHSCLSRFKKITNDWQPVNAWTNESSGCTEQQFRDNPPPFDSVPITNT